MQAYVGVDYPDERHAGEVEPLGYHLRADEYVELAAAEVSEYFAVIVAPLHCVAVHAPYSRGGEHRRYSLLDFLGSGAAPFRLWRAAFSACPRSFCGVPAQMAFYNILLLMPSHANGAVRAFLNFAAVGTFKNL